MIVVGSDIETTGLEIGDHRIIEIYAGLYDMGSRKKVDELFLRIDPQRNIQAEAQRVHGISSADLVGKPIWIEVARKVKAFHERADFVVGHNFKEFDLPFINYELKRVDVEPIDRHVIDTMQQGRWATPIGKVPNLGELCFACDVGYDPTLAHKADYDVGVMMDCFFKAYDWGMFRIEE